MRSTSSGFAVADRRYMMEEDKKKKGLGAGCLVIVVLSLIFTVCIFVIGGFEEDVELAETTLVSAQRSGGTIYVSGILRPSQSAKDVSIHCFAMLAGSSDYASGYMQVQDVVGGKEYSFEIDMKTYRLLSRPVSCTMDGKPR